ncbi:MAG: ATP-binding protein [Leptolyngbyaceae cyanobacterium SL_7_1]|nr:ATP-binding protein [Leptolyngbyaceae cyanobacterium SL_7_1]
MIQTFGDFIEDSSSTPEFLLIGFSPSSIPLKQRWRNNGLSASFIADYLITFFPVDENEPDAVHQRNKVTGAVRYIANELLENAMKFNDDSSPQQVSIKLELMSDRVLFRASNAVNPQTIPKFQAFIQELTTADAGDLIVRQVEKNTTEGWDSSGLGLLTIVSDYQAILGWRFETLSVDPPVITVTTTVQLPL